MKPEVLCFVAALLILLPGAVQSFGCSNCGGEIVPFEAGSFRIVEVNSVGANEAWLADALIDGQFDIDRENDIATLQYVREDTTYEVRFTINPK
ncbi:MAG: hypothetical protein R6X02_06045 [Enhygromyxa sp.]